jgi:hypothetical protein
VRTTEKPVVSCKQGHIVCIFAEWAIRGGPFVIAQARFEKIVEGTECTISGASGSTVGSIFSFKNGGFSGKDHGNFLIG